MLQRILRTDNDWTVPVARLVLAAIFLGHGSQKALGWFGGLGFSGTLDVFERTMGIPPVLTVLVMFTEIAGALGLLLGLLSRVAAFGLLVVMIIAPIANGLYPRFFMNWTGRNMGEGFEYHLLAIALLLGIVVRGAGALSVDRMIAKDAVAERAVAAGR